STLANKLIEDKHEVVVIDNLSMGKLKNLKISKRLRFIEASVNDYELIKEVLMNEKFNYIFHFAAIASVADSIERPVETHLVNFESVLYLVELVKKYQTNLNRLV